MKLHLKIAVLSPYIEAATAGPSYPNVFYNCAHFISNWRVIKYDIDKKKSISNTTFTYFECNVTQNYIRWRWLKCSTHGLATFMKWFVVSNNCVISTRSF
jgi:hypothetical protein